MRSHGGRPLRVHDPGPNRYEWAGISGDPYVAGHPVAIVGGTIDPDVTPVDLAFKTYVAQPAAATVQFPATARREHRQCDRHERGQQLADHPGQDPAHRGEWRADHRRWFAGAERHSRSSGCDHLRGRSSNRQHRDVHEQSRCRLAHVRVEQRRLLAVEPRRQDVGADARIVLPVRRVRRRHEGDERLRGLPAQVEVRAGARSAGGATGRRPLDITEGGKEKALVARAFSERERMKRLELSTFCMATSPRGWRLARWPGR